MQQTKIIYIKILNDTALGHGVTGTYRSLKREGNTRNSFTKRTMSLHDDNSDTAAHQTA
jgi:hypothetical protein